MHLDHLRSNFKKREDSSGLLVTVRRGVNSDEIAEAEQSLRVAFPAQVRMFYECCDGLWVGEPSLEISPLALLTLDAGCMTFCIVDECHEIGFDCSSLNAAGQWDIVTLSTGYRITHTMASFWSNKIWKWIDDRRPFWRAEEY